MEFRCIALNGWIRFMGSVWEIQLRHIFVVLELLTFVRKNVCLMKSTAGRMTRRICLGKRAPRGSVNGTNGH